MAQTEKQGNQNVLTVRGHILHLTKGVQNTKNRHSGNMWSITKKHMPQLSARTFFRSPKPQMRHFFTAEQFIHKFVANVVIQIAQPQLCYPNPKQNTLDLKSSMCRKVSNAAKTILNVDITGKDLHESILSLSAPVPPCTIQVHDYQIQPILQTHLKSIHNTKIHLFT